MTKRILSLLLAAILALAVCAAALAEEAEEEEEFYYIYTNNTGKTLNIRDGMTGEVIDALEQGTKVTVISFVSESWAEISYGDGKTGYVNRRYLITVDPAELEKVIAEEKQQFTGDVLTDITAEFESALYPNEPYTIIVRPARVTSWIDMRWVPSSIGPVVDRYKAGQELLVIAELKNYLQVQDPQEKTIGFIHKMFAVPKP